MDESGFRHSLTLSGVKPKEVSDALCRVKKLEADLHTSLDAEFRMDKGVSFLRLFLNKGLGIKKINKYSTLPVGEYSLATYKLAAKKYFTYLDSL